MIAIEADFIFKTELYTLTSFYVQFERKTTQ